MMKDGSEKGFLEPLKPTSNDPTRSFSTSRNSNLFLPPVAERTTSNNHLTYYSYELFLLHHHQHEAIFFDENQFRLVFSAAFNVTHLLQEKTEDFLLNLPWRNVNVRKFSRREKS